MDLGATICGPRKPQCLICPLAKRCEAFGRNEQDTLPVKVKRKTTPHYEVAVGLIWKGRGNGKKILIDQRKPEGLLGGLWEFPGGKCEEGEALQDCLTREVKEELGITIKVLKKIAAVDHAYTHFRVTLHAFDCRYTSGIPKAIGCTDFKWVTIEELDRYPLPKANHKILAILRTGDWKK